MLSPGQMEKLLGRDDIPLLYWWGMWADATATYNAVLTGDPYPVKGAFNSSGNFMHQCNSDMAWEALKSLDFYVENNLWHTPGGTVCDIKMPAAHFLELNSPRSSQGASGAMGATIKCIDPPGEAKFDGEIIEMIYKQKGIPYNIVPGYDAYPGVEGMLDMAVAGFEPEGWEKFAADFQEHGWWDCKQTEPELWGTYRRYETGAMRGRNAGGFVGTVGDWKPGFYTPTKKIEIWSTVVESYHPDGQWNLPTYTEPPHSPVSDPEMFAEYPLIITTGRRIPVYFHSEHRQLPWCRELWPAPRVEINPDDAKEYGIEQGDWVWIETPYGKIREVADLYYGVRKGTINCEHQWWFPELAKEYGIEQGDWVWIETPYGKIREVADLYYGVRKGTINCEHQWWFPELDQNGKGHELCAVNHLIDPWARDPHETPYGKIREVADLYYGVRKGTINCEHQWWFPELDQNGKGHELCAVNHLIDPWARDPHCGASNLRAYLGKIYQATPENSPFGNPVPCGHDGTEIIHDATDPRLKEWLTPCPAATTAPRSSTMPRTRA